MSGKSPISIRLLRIAFFVPALALVSSLVLVVFIMCFLLEVLRRLRLDLEATERNSAFEKVVTDAVTLEADIASFASFDFST